MLVELWNVTMHSFLLPCVLGLLSLKKSHFEIFYIKSQAYR